MFDDHEQTRLTYAENPRRPQNMERLGEISEATMALIFKNYLVVLALAGLVLAFTLYIYLYRAPLLSEYFANAEKAVTEKKETPPATA